MSVLKNQRSPALFQVKKSQGKLVSYEGFFLKPGYYYGYDSKGRPVATSQWTVNGRICVYVKENGKWTKHWIREDEFRSTYPGYR